MLYYFQESFGSILLTSSLAFPTPSLQSAQEGAQNVAMNQLRGWNPSFHNDDRSADGK